MTQAQITQLFDNCYFAEVIVAHLGERFTDEETKARRERYLNKIYVNRLIREYNLYKFHKVHA